MEINQSFQFVPFKKTSIARTPEANRASNTWSDGNDGIPAIHAIPTGCSRQTGVQAWSF